MKDGFTLKTTLPAQPSQIYKAWISTKGHSEMTGSPAKVIGRVGGKFTAWDGYIFGTTLELKSNERIVQAWRTTEFPEDAPDSKLEISFEKAGNGTRVILTHTHMPKDQVESYRQGWEDFYFRPMREYFKG